MPGDSYPPGSTPVPDPTVLTTEQLLREIGALRSIMELQAEMHAALDQQQFKAVYQQFAAVDTQLKLVEAQRVEQKSDTKLAVDAALQAQKEAVREQTLATATAIGKSETITSEQLKQLGVNFQTAFAGQSATVADLKDRVTALEAVRLGGREQVAESRAGLGAIYAFIGAAVGLIGMTVAIIVALS